MVHHGLEANSKIQLAADALWNAWSNRKPTSPVRKLMDGMVDIDLAYAI